MYNHNSGYHGYSMSKRAVEVYQNGEMPLSKWNKKELLSRIEKFGVDINTLSKFSKEALQDCFLYNSSWHHTSNMFNKTNFYSINDCTIQVFLDYPEEILKSLQYFDNHRTVKSKKKGSETFVIVKIRYGTWERSRRHPKLVEQEPYGIKKGDWVWIDIGVKKSLKGKHCDVIETYKRAPNGTADKLNKIKKSLKKQSR